MSFSDDSSFVRIADETLTSLFDHLEETIGEVADIDLRDGILTIDLDVGGQYVINKHFPNRQIWLSSPVSGASHFDYDENRGWMASREAVTLRDILERELSQAVGKAASL
jgi:iron-sulfur cluster assembly protein CyaY